jgi:serine/threonine protein phosphatase PrpC
MGQGPIPDPSAFLVLAILAAHRVINARSRRAGNKELSARTTCVLCLVQNGYAYWAHVGDSRLYHFRDGALLSRTTDHTTVERLQQEGVIDTDSRNYRKIKGQLLQAVGGPRRPRVTVGPETRLQHGDTLLLCSDGLWGAIKDDELTRYMSRDDIEDVVEDMLIKAENRMNRRCDNISAVAFRWLSSATHAPPLQKRAPGDIDQDVLWGQIRGAGTSTEAKPAEAEDSESTAPTKRSGSRADLDARIKELESFINNLDDLG